MNAGRAVMVVGEGGLAELVCRQLSGVCRVVRRTGVPEEVPEAAAFALVLQDEWQSSVYREAEQAMQRAGLPWMSGFAVNSEGVVGPLVRPGTPGCSQCADMRRLRAGSSRSEMSALQMMLLPQGGTARHAAASQTELLQIAHLVAAETRRVLEGRLSLTEQHVYLLNLKTLQSSLHFFLPDPSCSVCGHLPDDSPEAACINLQPSPKIGSGSYRSRRMDDFKEALVNDYLDSRTGLFNEKQHHHQLPFASVTVNLPLLMGNEITSGRSHSYGESELTAILEGLERYCGLMPRGKRTAIRGSFRNLADRALDPVTVGVYSQEQYALPDFPFEPFDPERQIDWVWGYSFLRERPILVPEQLAYYSMGDAGGFVHETSNGCAIGGSLEEAVFYGMMEVVERDAFLMAWYAQLPIPRLDPASAGDRELALMIDRVRAAAGYEVQLFNSTMEHGIPSIWAIAINRKSQGMHLHCAAGAHADPLRAAKSAVHELAGLMLGLDDTLDANRETYEQMYRNSSLVRGMEDHPLLYGLPQAEERLQFMLDDNRPLRTFDEAFKPKVWQSDLTQDLRELLEQFLRLNLEVIVVDQTTPEIARNGLFCVKVLIPGMLPMTFGHHLIRLTGLERVLRVPMELGYTKRPLTIDRLNPHPHPFP